MQCRIVEREEYTYIASYILGHTERVSLSGFKEEQDQGRSRADNRKDFSLEHPVFKAS
jgi:hypothetical protein